MTITEAIENVSNIYVTAIVNECEVRVPLTRQQALDSIVAAEATSAVLNPHNDNFYVSPEIRHTQVAWIDGANDSLIIGQ